MAALTFKAGVSGAKRAKAAGNASKASDALDFSGAVLNQSPGNAAEIQKAAPDAYNYYQSKRSPQAKQMSASLDAQREQVSGRTNNIKTGNQGLGVKDTTQRKKRLASGNRPRRTLLGGGGSTKSKLGL